jgi:hypothetical protein
MSLDAGRRHTAKALGKTESPGPLFEQADDA